MDQLEVLLRNRLAVRHVLAEQPEGVLGDAAAEADLGPAAREQIERREVFREAHRVVARVVLAEPEAVEAHLLGVQPHVTGGVLQSIPLIVLWSMALILIESDPSINAASGRH
ncbi:MAG TPA: hypothetical protein VF210_13155 [Pseudomonadales bacterium]